MLMSGKGNSIHACLGWVLVAIVMQAPAAADQTPYVATPLTGRGASPRASRARLRREGGVYAVNFAKQRTIGKVTPDGKGEVFVTLPGKSVGNGIVFDRQGQDVRRRLRRAQRPADRPEDEGDRPSSPTSDDEPAERPGHRPGRHALRQRPRLGQRHRAGLDGSTRRARSRWSPPNMGTTNGIEVSPDGKTLYVNESVQRNVWAFPIRPDGTPGRQAAAEEVPRPRLRRHALRRGRQPLHHPPRQGHRRQSCRPRARCCARSTCSGKRPSNLCFGGPDGRTVYVTEVEHTRLVQFRVEKPGLAWQRGRGSSESARAWTPPSPRRRRTA